MYYRTCCGTSGRTGACASRRRRSGEKAWLPSLTAVLRLRPGGDGGPPVEQRVLDGLDFAARLAVLELQQPAGRPAAAADGSAGRRRGAGDRGQPVAAGLQPAFAWKGGYLVLASTPEAVRRFVPPTQGASQRRADRRRSAAGPAGTARLGRLSEGVSRPCRHTLRMPTTSRAAEADGRVERLVKGLELFDAVEVVQRTAPGRAVISVRLKTLPAEEKPH